MSAQDRLVQRVASAAQRIGQEQARLLFRELRNAERLRIRQRRADFRRRLQLGTAVLAADLDGWEASEIVGMLLDAKERVEGSPTMRLGMRKRGAGYLADKVRKPTTCGKLAVDEHVAGSADGTLVPTTTNYYARSMAPRFDQPS